MPIPFTCPHCGRQTTVDDRYAGQSGPCAGCGGPVTVPRNAASESFRAPAWDEPSSGLDGRVAEDDDNPYRSPAASFEPAMQTPDAELNRGLLWLLFSTRGRIPRRVYWGVTVAKYAAFYAAMFLLAGLSDFLIDQEPDLMFVLGVLLFGVPLYWITIAIQVKRWHDRGKSGWWFLVGLIPYVGPIWVFIEVGCLRGTYGPNDYGEDPT
jgi:uncharacterized membrane protein YhaH (DUF805 family)